MQESTPTFRGFETVRVLGKGGMGTVYLARDQRLGRQVAIKVLNASEISGDERKARFLREARSAAAVRHQNVATIHEVDETDDGVPYIVMEYCEGETLSQRLRRKPLEVHEFLSISRQIVAGVSAAHEQGILHRDIKSANIVVEPSGLTKILDFGLAKPIPRALTDPGLEKSFESATGHFFGTLHFISPEQARGQNADVRSDLFSVGVVLYLMATGQLPFNADAPLLVLEQIRDSEPEPFVPLDPNFPAVAAKIISKLLQKNPADRYPNARELLGDLEEIDTPTVRMTQTTTRNTMLGRTIRRPRWIRVAVTAAAAVIVASAIFLAQRTESRVTRDEPAAAMPAIRSLAVLPLRNIANTQQDEFLSVGLADALVTELQQIPSLQVRPTSAVLEFQKNKLDAKSAGEELKVDGVLEGQFLAAGDLVRVTLQLTDSRTGFSVWSDSVNGNRGDLLKLMDEVSARTVSGLNERIGIQRAQLTRSAIRSSNPKAYEEYLRARSLSGSFEPKHYALQIAALKRAITLDPTFAAAYADLATTLSLGQARSLASSEDVARAEWYARQAVRLDPNLAQAHLALGRVFVRDPDRFRESVRELLAALRLESTDTTALHSLVAYFVSTGDLQKAECIGDLLIKVDPMSNEALARGYWYVNAIDPEGALKAADIALASRETAMAGHDMRGMSYLLLGDMAAVEQEAAAATKLVPQHYLGKSLTTLAAAGRGDRAKAMSLLPSWDADAKRNHWAALRVALVHAKLGNNAEALVWLKRCSDLGNHSWYALVKHPWLAPLHGTPEFQQVVGKIKSDLDDVRDDVVGVYQLLCR
jgi:eukaryotic-like serine/threonine-protein kinase